MNDRYDTFRIGITATTTVVRDLQQNKRIIAVHDDERSARADARRRNHVDVNRRVAAMKTRSDDPSPSGPASQLERGINAPSRDHENGSER